VTFNFNRDGQTLATITIGTGEVKFWEVPRGTGQFSIFHGHHLDGAVFAPDDKHFASFGDSAVKLWDRNGMLIREFLPLAKSSIVSLAFGKALAWGNSDGTFCLYELASKEPRTIRGLRGQVQVAFPADGQMLV